MKGMLIRVVICALFIFVFEGNSFATPVVDGQDAYSPTAMTPMGDQIAMGFFDGTIRFYDPALSETRISVAAHSKPVECLSSDIFGRKLLSSSTDGKVSLRDGKTGAEIYKTYKTGASLKVCAMDMGGKYALVGGGSTLYIWDTETWENVGIWENIPQGVYSVAVHYNGQVVAIGGKDGKISLYSLPDGDLLATLQNGRGLIMSLAFAPKSDILAVGSYDKTVSVWNVATKALLKSRPFHSDAVGKVAVSAEGKYVVSGGDDGEVFLWEVGADKWEKYLGSGQGILSIALDPAFRFIAVGVGKPYENKKYIKIWYPRHPKQLREVFTFYASQATVSSIGYIHGDGPYGEKVQIYINGISYPFGEKANIYNKPERLKLDLGKGFLP